MQGEMARYDLIRDFYIDAVGMELGDAVATTVVELAGDVRGLRVADLACGHGPNARALARRGALVTGYDISDALLEQARSAEAERPLGITYVKENVTLGSALAGETFDVVTCNHGLADIDDLQGALATVARVLRPGGRFAFLVIHPCFPGWDETAPSSWPRAGGYWEEGWWLATNPGIRGKVGSNHRTLSTYVNSLVRHGLVLEELVEPVPAGRSRERQLAAQPGAGPLPMFLAMRCRKA